MIASNILEDVIINEVKLYRFNEQFNDIQQNKVIIANT